MDRATSCLRIISYPQNEPYPRMPHTQQSTDCEGCVVVDVNVILCGTKNIVRPSCGMQAHSNIYLDGSRTDETAGLRGCRLRPPSESRPAPKCEGQSILRARARREITSLISASSRARGWPYPFVRAIRCAVPHGHSTGTTHRSRGRGVSL